MVALGSWDSCKQRGRVLGGMVCEGGRGKVSPVARSGMKITWLSPWGDGWSMAHRLRQQGHKVVYRDFSGHGNGAGFLPSVSNAEWLNYALRSDLVIVDANFPSRRTRRSWAPSDEVVALGAVRKAGIIYVGPVPTTELIENDPRYQRKTLNRVGLAHGTEGLPVTLTCDTMGHASLLLRHRYLVSEGNGPEVGNLADIIFPLASGTVLAQSLGKLAPFMETVKHAGSWGMDLCVSREKVLVSRLHTSFLYPAVLAQFGTNATSNVLGLVVTLCQLTPASPQMLDGVTDLPHFFGAEIHRGDLGIEAHGPILGACVGYDTSWNPLSQKVEHQLRSLLKPGWGFRERLSCEPLIQLTEWGYL